MNPTLNVEPLTGFQRGKKRTFNDGEVILGTNESCHIRFDATWDKTVSAKHATLRCNGGAWTIEDHSRDGTFNAGRRITREPLTCETTIELGKGGPKVKLSVTTVAESAPPVHTGHTSAERPVPVVTATPVAPARMEPSHAPAAPGRPSSRPKWLPAAIAAAVVLLIVGGIVMMFASKKSAPDGKAGAAGAKWELVVEMGGEIFPSFLVASATMKESPFDKIYDSPDRLGDKRGVIGVEIVSPAANAKVRVEIGENEILRASVLDTELPEAGKTYRLFPKVDYRYEALSKIKQTLPTTINAKVTMDGAAAGQKAMTVRVASINDCPFNLAVKGSGDDADYMNMGWMFAAYVNENHPISDELRREALKSGIVQEFLGYQRGKEGVYLQVFAIWNALQQRGVRYSNITTTPGASKEVYSQYVRFVDQSINNSQANCVDGSVLFASILRQIGIEPVLVLVSGHMFVGFYLDPQGKELDFLETTMLGHSPDSTSGGTDGRSVTGAGVRTIAAVRGIIEPAVNAGINAKSSQESFLAAIHTARKEAKENFQQDDGAVARILSGYNSRAYQTQKKSTAQCQIMPVAKAREMGVLPIGYQP
jgi:hypothetical protein